jgi:2-polyprenyl-6-methoxyphenol hydroxylase-like FAD-dependent oxidoreductase
MTETPHPVVISGAGPNGLLLAGELALAGVRPVVLDVLPGPSDEPKANGLVGQVIRMLDMRGLYRELGGPPFPPRPIRGYSFSGIPVPFADMADNPMYALMIPQPRLVHRLQSWARRLGADIRWGHQLTDLLPGDDGVAVSVTGPDGSYRLSARYLVGADGGRSRVRKGVGVDFPGVTTDMTTRLAHVRIPDRLRADDGSIDVPGHGRIAFGHNRFEGGGLVFADFEPSRSMVGTIEFVPDEAPVDEPMTIKELRDSITRVLGVDVPIEAPDGEGPHALRRIQGQNTRQADRYRAGNVFLLGDAAHVHSAMGRPGLNLGLQDAVNLGWKLAAEVKGWAPTGLLDTYESERRPVGERVMMHSLSQTALMAPGPEVAALRELFAELLAQPQAAGHIAHLMAGSDVRYDIGDAHPLSGRMAPEVTLGDGRRIADLMHAARPVLVDFTDGTFAVAAQPAGHRVEILTATGLAGPSALLIRPDGYVAWAADASTADDVERMRLALERWFAVPAKLD